MSNNKIESSLADMFLKEWQQIRQLTYDYLDLLDESHLNRRLPFAESRPIGYQFWCMVGAHESYLKKLETGEWQGFACSLDNIEKVTPTIIKQKMTEADTLMKNLLPQIDFEQLLKNGQSPAEVVMQMIKHEMHHHGQLINLMFCHHLPIPDSWHQAWHLAY